MDNPETLATLSTHKTQKYNTKGAIKNGQSWDTSNIEYTQDTRSIIPKEQSRMDNPETLATLGIQDTRNIIPKEQSRMDNPETLATLSTHRTQEV